MDHLSRRMLLGGAAALGTCLAGPVRAETPRGQPIRIGCITSLSGPQEVLGRPILDGAEIAAEQINAAGGVLGRPLLIVAADDRADPRRAVGAAHAFAKDGVHLLCGAVTSGVALAISPELQALDSIMVTCAAASEKLTHEAYTPHYFRVTDQTYMRNRAQAYLMAKRYPQVTRWAAIVPDIEYGRSTYAAFQDGLRQFYPGEAGCEATLAAPIVAPAEATDFGKQLAQLRESGAEGLFTSVYGGNAVGLYEQLHRLGLLNQVHVMADSTNEFLVPMALGSQTPEHLWLGMTWYFGGYQSLPMGRALYEANMRRSGNGMPFGFLSSGHSGVLAYAGALAKAGRTDTAAVITALEGLSFDTAKGRVTLRAEDHQAICDVNFVRIKASDAPPGLDINDYLRPDIEIAEFVRYDGASVIEPPTPGRAISYRG